MVDSWHNDFFQVYGSLPSTPAPPVDISDLITEAYTNYNQITAEVIENMRFKQRMEVSTPIGYLYTISKNDVILSVRKRYCALGLELGLG